MADTGSDARARDEEATTHTRAAPAHADDEAGRHPPSAAHRRAAAAAIGQRRDEMVDRVGWSRSAERVGMHALQSALG